VTSSTPYPDWFGDAWFQIMDGIDLAEPFERASANRRIASSVAPSTHFQMKTLKHVSTEMALHVLAYNMKRVMSILGVGGLIEAIRA